MSLYRRFVTYLFRYENGKKGNGCGFAKLEIRQELGRLELQIRGCTDGLYTVYLFHAAKRGPVGVRIGEIKILDTIGREVFSFDADAVGKSPYALDSMSGIYMTAEGNEFVVSQWDDESINWDVFHVYGAGQDYREAGDCLQEMTDEFQEEESESSEEYGRLLKKSGTSEKDDEPQEGSSGSEGDDEPQKGSVGSEEQNGVLSASSTGRKNNVLLSSTTGKENGVPTASADILPYMSAWEKQWQRFCASHPIICPFDEAQDIYAVKMDLRDIRMLPRQYHSLANNSFLLHGYFNYRYLLFGHMDREERRWFIAVPGVFQNQEQLLAGIFGFTEFRTKHVTKQKTGEFGFWYRCLEL